MRRDTLTDTLLGCLVIAMGFAPYALMNADVIERAIRRLLSAF